VYAPRASMPFHDLLGRFATLTIERLTPPGAYLRRPDASAEPPAVILLPRSEIPEGAGVGDELEVFVHLDSDDRPIATRRSPPLEVGEVAFLRVTAVTEVGAFVDWGLVKELLVPFARQTRALRVGESHPIGLYIDSSGRLAGTMRVSELLKDKAEFELDEWVEGEAWRREPGVGVFVIIERAFVGLLPESEPHELGRGDAARFRIANVLPDGKVELSLRGHAHEELENDARKILAALALPGAPRLGERSTPEQLRDAFGLSKKAFKRAVGRLLKQGDVTIDREGFVTPSRG
jgi:uncharacterized protein